MVDPKSIRAHCEARLAGMKSVRQDYEAEAEQIARFAQPARSRFLAGGKDRSGARRRQWNRTLFDPHGIEAFRTLTNGMTSGLSSASRPWFTLKTPDDDLMEADGVRAWLSAVERRIYAFLASTNFYGAAKAALLGFVKVLSIEGANKGVHVNAISPVASTRMTEAEFGELAELFSPDFVSQLVLYLASERCSVSGEVFSVGGGQISRIFVGLTEGIFRSDGVFSPREIEAALPEIMNVSGHSIPRSLADEWEKIMRLHQIQTARD